MRRVSPCLATLLTHENTMGLLLRRVCKLPLRTALMKSYSDSAVRLHVLPSSCMFDEPVQIRLSGLVPQQHVELQSSLKDDKGVHFRAAATYRADGNGEVDLSRQPSLGGSYTGVEPMGLFWSMRPDVPHSKVVKRDASTPLNYHLEASSGGEVLAKVTNERHFAAPGVRRTPVVDDRIRGTLYTPPGEGPFPGIIDLYTLGGIMSEPRAALLASRGFAVLALAYYGYKDMPKKANKFDLEYFEEAAVFLQKLPEVQKTGIGIVSISKGGELALSMASFLPNVKATVCINTCNAIVLSPLHYKGMVIPPLMANANRMDTIKPGIMDVSNVLDDPMAEENLATVVPIERASCSFLFVVSEDDRNWNSPYYAEQACRRLKEHGKTNYEVVTYPKAGHFLEVPYMPHHSSGFHPAVGKLADFGGEPKFHAHAQVTATAYQNVLEDFMIPSAEDLYVDASSSRTWPPPMLPEAPKPGLMPMPSQCLTGRTTRRA